MASLPSAGVAAKAAAPRAETVPLKRVHIRKDKTNPRRFAYLILLLFAQPPAWPLFTFGAILVVAAILFHGWAAGYLARAGYKERAKLLTVCGPYRHTRNPYYVAHLTMDFGFFCLGGLPWLYTFYFPVIYAVYRRWVMGEEPFLEREFGDDYRRFKQAVPRWRIRLTPGPAFGQQRFSWAIFQLNKELPRTTAHVLVLAIFVAYFLFGNPMAGVEPLWRATVVGVVVVWFLLRDMTPLEVARRHAGWLALAVAIATGAAVFLAVAPVWQRVPAPGASLAAGLVLAAFLVLTTWPAAVRRTGKALADIFPQPMCQWCLIGIALGLLSLTPAGIWIGILLPFFLWALVLAGVVGIPAVRASNRTALALSGVFAVFALSAIRHLAA